MLRTFESLQQPRVEKKNIYKKKREEFQDNFGCCGLESHLYMRGGDKINDHLALALTGDCPIRCQGEITYQPGPGVGK